MGRNAAQQRFIVAAITHRFRGGRHKRFKPRGNAGLLLRAHQAHLAQIAHRLVAAAAAEDEIDRRQHLPFRHLRHHKRQRRRFRLGWLRGFWPLAPVPLRGTPHLAVGVQARALFIEQRVQPLGTAEAELQRHRPVIAHHQLGGAMHPLDPIGELPGIGHRGRQRHQLHHRRAVND